MLKKRGCCAFLNCVECCVHCSFSLMCGGVSYGMLNALVAVTSRSNVVLGIGFHFEVETQTLLLGQFMFALRFSQIMISK